MKLDWQDMLAAGIVIAALAYLAVRIRRLSRARPGARCANCTVCGPEPREESPLLSIGLPQKASEPSCDAQGEEITA